MPIEVKMAKLSPTMESGQMVRWLVKVGDKVQEGQTLAEVQTDKAIMPMESFDEGVVAVLDVKEGDDIQLGQRVMVLATKGESVEEVASKYGGSKAPAAPPAKSEAASAPANVEASSPPAAPAKLEAAPAGSNGHSSAVAPATTGHDAPGRAGERVKSTPLARKIAAAANLDLSLVPPSGPGGRVIRRDVEEFLSQGGAARARGVARGAVPGASSSAALAVPSIERIPLSRIRATIAKRMGQAKREAPDIHLVVDVQLDAVLTLREKLNKQLEAEKIKLSVNDFVTKAVAMALRRHPEMNAHFTEEAILRHAAVNIGIAVALDQGLIVPVLKNADQLGLKEIRQGTEALATAARTGKLTPDQLSGGTFTISNLGMFGIKQFDAILNLPEVGILAVGAAEKRPVIQGNQLTIGTLMTLTLTADHRALDGADAARFLQTLKGFLDDPATMLL